MNIGDIITTYHKGFWRLKDFSKPNISSFPLSNKNFVLCYYEPICDSKFNFKKGKIKHCHISYCKVVDEERLKELGLEAEKKYLDTIKNLDKIRKLL